MLSTGSFIIKVCLDILFVSQLYFADNIEQKMASSESAVSGAAHSGLADLESIHPSLQAKLCKLSHEYRKMLDHSFSNSRDLGDLLRFLPGILVQKHLTMQEMAGLYRVQMDLNMFNAISISICVLPPPFFSPVRSLPTTLPFKFSMIWKILHIIMLI